MSQPTFNRLITLILFVYFMGMYTLSYITGKPLDWQNLLVFIWPSVNHIVHQYAQTTIATSTLKATTVTDVARIEKNGVHS